MRKYLITLIFLKIAFAAASQPPSASDTLCILVQEGRQMLKVKDSLQIMKTEKDSLEALAALRDGYIQKQQATIDSLSHAAIIGARVIADVKRSRDYALQEGQLWKQNYEVSLKTIRKVKRSKVWIVIGAVVAEAATIYLMAK